MAQPLELHEMNLPELFEKLRMADDEFEEWMVGLGLLHSSMMCDSCNQPMQDKIHCNKRMWVCERAACRFGPTSKNKPLKGFLSVGVFFVRVFFFFFREIGKSLFSMSR